MTPRSIRRAAERKSRKEAERKAKNIAPQTEELVEIHTDTVEIDILDEREHPELPTVSAAKLAANRSNAQRSCGPKTSEGKTKVSLNAVKTALTGRTVLLPGDDAAAYEHHVQAFADEYSPIGARECDLVQSIADSWWRMQRIPCLESALFAQGYIEFADSFDDHDPSVRPSLITAKTFLSYEKPMRNLQLQEARLFRRYEKDRAELVALQQARKQHEAEALDRAAALYRSAKRANQPFMPTNFGFEFSTAQIEQHLERIQAREALAAHSKTRAQAA